MRALASRLVRASTYLVLLSLLGNTALAPTAPLTAQAAALAAPPAVAPAAAPVLVPSTSTPAPQPDVMPTSLPAHAQDSTPAQSPALAFIENTGETDAKAKYFVRGLGGAVFFTDDEIIFSLPTGTKDSTKQADDPRERKQQKQHPPSVGRLRFQGANPSATIVKGAALPGTASFFMGSDASTWKSGLTTYASVTYQNLYPGIDVAFTGTDNQLKSTYTVAPGADPGQIRWHYPGAVSAAIDATGALRLTLPLPNTTITETIPITGVLTEDRPVAWQDIDGQRLTVDVQYRLQGKDQISFTLGSYDTAQPLVIDPTLGYQTTFSTSTGGGVATFTDNAGTTSVYITGQTNAITLPNALNINAGNTDAFVSKVDANGTVLYTLFLGGPGDDAGNDITVDSTGNAYLTGWTRGGLPVQNGYDSTYNNTIDAFVAKISTSGSILYCTYLGGSGFDYGNGIAVDAAGNTYIIGETNSGAFTTDQPFPTQNPYQNTFSGGNGNDAFVTKLNAFGTQLAYSTYFGGANNNDTGYAIAVDRAGSAYITGSTSSSLFPTQGTIQAFGGGDCSNKPCDGILSIIGGREGGG